MKILCPTDFSDHSTFALEYAMNLANTLDAELHILSVFQVRNSSSSFMSIDDAVRKGHEEDMQQLLAGLGPLISTDRPPITKVMKGYTVNSILRYAHHFGIDLIVMGTQGGNSLRTTLFGSTTKKLASKSAIPILAIPETVKHKLTSNSLLLALDDKELNDEEVFKIPLSIAKKLSLNIDILHIESKDEMIPFDPSISIYLDGVIGEVDIVKSKDTITAIKEYAENRNVGMLMMISREKSFLQKLLTIGNTSAELSKTNIPLMILPE